MKPEKKSKYVERAKIAIIGLILSAAIILFWNLTYGPYTVKILAALGILWSIAFVVRGKDALRSLKLGGVDIGIIALILAAALSLLWSLLKGGEHYDMRAWAYIFFGLLILGLGIVPFVSIEILKKLEKKLENMYEKK